MGGGRRIRLALAAGTGRAGAVPPARTSATRPRMSFRSSMRSPLSCEGQEGKGGGAARGRER
jgi:hypothetical protein